MSTTVILFSILAIAAIATGVSVIINRNPVASAMSLILHFFALAGLYLTLNAQFLAAIQILVYAGAIMVLVVFVVMLLNLGKESALTEQFNPRTGIAVSMGFLLIAQLAIAFIGQPTGYTQLSDKATHNGTAEAVGTVLFSEYLFPFEAISLLLLVAIVGSILLAKKQQKESA